MPYLVQCNQCAAAVTIASGRDPDSALNCVCCVQPHHHGLAANACTGDHGACPAPATCRVNPGGQCPGGHCGLGVAGCTVCRPVTITATGGTVQLRATVGTAPPRPAPGVAIGRAALQPVLSAGASA